MLFVKQNSIKHREGKHLGQWHKDLCEVFQAALNLKMESLIEPNALFRWPRPGESFDRSSMDAPSQEDVREEAFVQVGLLPSLSVKPEIGRVEQGPKENLVFRANVLVHTRVPPAD